ncbi:MAG TPA: hypothetical protein PKD64_02065 [Pirellulaceae bacterium]|nr:hypothetical protein [Pirellulaceae bacterium]HMO90956.1 hypothetical protein [Pirellulaceae bacterium]HMP69854.1 hypothetical protein [Pirellulaceae bacterium]
MHKPRVIRISLAASIAILYACLPGCGDPDDRALRMKSGDVVSVYNVTGMM